MIDMCHSFKAAVRQALSNPVIVADRFHFCVYIPLLRVHLLGAGRGAQTRPERLERLRPQEVQADALRLSQKQCEINRSGSLILGSLSEDEQRTEAGAYELKEAYCQWFQDSKKRDPQDILGTKGALTAFCQLMKQADIPGFQKALKTFRFERCRIAICIEFPSST